MKQWLWCNDYDDDYDDDVYDYDDYDDYDYCDDYDYNYYDYYENYDDCDYDDDYAMIMMLIYEAMILIMMQLMLIISKTYTNIWWKKWHSIKMFRFMKQMFVSTMIYFGYSLSNINSLQCISISNQKCKVRPEIVNVNSSDPVFFPFSIKTSKCSGSCNNINDPYAKLCVPDVIKKLNIKVFILLSRTNEARHIKWHETSKCKCRLNFVIINNAGIKINVGVNVKNWLIKVYVIKDLFGILVIASANVINLVILVNIYIIQIVNVGKNQLIN